MKLYLISQSTNNDWDTYDSAVVAANSEDEARLISPGCESVWCNPAQVKVRYIGKAGTGTTAGVILASFNAG